MEDFLPVRFVVETNDYIAPIHQPACDLFIGANLIRFIVGRAIDVNRGIVLAIKEIGSRGAVLDQVLGIAGRSQQKGIHVVEPLALKLAVAALSKGGHALRTGAHSTGGLAF